MITFLVLAYSTKFLLAATLFVGSMIAHAVLSYFLVVLLIVALMVVMGLCSIASATVLG